MNYCMQCGSADVCRRIPEMDNRPRCVCNSCGFVFYDNPRIIAGCVSSWEDDVLLCRRAIEPRSGLWTLPAGFMELDETAPEAAIRETGEEANARVRIDALLAIFSLPHVNQVFLMYRGGLCEDRHSPGVESTQTELFSEARIPWKELAFASVHYALRLFFRDRRCGDFRAHSGAVLRDANGSYRLTLDNEQPFPEIYSPPPR